MSPNTAPVNFAAGLLLYVADPLNPGQYIPENDPRYAVVEAWMGTQKEDSITRTNALAVFHRGMSNWQQQAQQADAYRLPRPVLPTIPQVEVDQVIDEPDGSYAIKTTFEPVASYPDPLIPGAPVAVGTGANLFAAERAAAPATVSPDVAALTALVQQLLAALAAQSQKPAA